MADDEERRGMPIYFDPVDRRIADSLSEGDVDINDWYPSNDAARKLWRCLECLRDLDELLEDIAQQKNATKKKRRLKIAVTPLHSFATALDDLLNDIQCNKDTSSKLTPDQREQIARIQKQFALMLPHDHKAPLSIVRNKLSSHIDRSIHPGEARDLGRVVDQSEFGRWLHICLHLCLDLTKLDIYYWTCEAPSDEFVRVMSNEPYLVTFRVEGNRISELVGVHVVKQSPRNDIPELVERLVKSSEWMFKPGQPRIGSLKEDTKENWNTFLGNLTLKDPF
jgi:hypothetical protein